MRLKQSQLEIYRFLSLLVRPEKFMFIRQFVVEECVVVINGAERVISVGGKSYYSRTDLHACIAFDIENF